MNKSNHYPQTPQTYRQSGRIKDKTVVEPFAKTFKKKSDLYEHGSSIKILSSRNHNDKDERTPNKSRNSISPRQPGKVVAQKNENKALIQKAEKPVSRLCLKEAAYQESGGSTLGKLQQILGLFNGGKGGTAKQSFQFLEQAYENYISLLCQWQKQQWYDQTDKIIYQLIHHFVVLLESFSQELLQGYNRTLIQCENAIARLQAENQLYRMQSDDLKNFEAMRVEMQERWFEQHQKSQWSSLIFNALQRQKFDLQGFVNIMNLSQPKQLSSQGSAVNLEVVSPQLQYTIKQTHSWEAESVQEIVRKTSQTYCFERK